MWLKLLKSVLCIATGVKMSNSELVQQLKFAKATVPGR